MLLYYLDVIGVAVFAASVAEDAMLEEQWRTILPPRAAAGDAS